MRITDKVDIAGSGVQRPEKTREKGSGAQANEVLPEDQISVSDKAKGIGRLQAEVSKLPDIRTDRVDDVKNAINAGTYNVKGEAVAGKVLKEAIIDAIV